MKSRRDFISNALLFTFLIGGVVAWTGVILQPDIAGYKGTLPGGRSLSTSSGPMDVDHAMWVRARVADSTIMAGLGLIGAFALVAIVVRLRRGSGCFSTADVWVLNRYLATTWLVACALMFARVLLSLAGVRF